MIPLTKDDLVKGLNIKEVTRHKMFLLYICYNSDNKGSPTIKYTKK